MPGAVRNGAKIGILGGFGDGGAFLFGFSEIVATFAIANQTYIILSFLPCVFSPEKIDDCPAYGGFSVRETWRNNTAEMLCLVGPPKCRAFVVI